MIGVIFESWIWNFESGILNPEHRWRRLNRFTLINLYATSRDVACNVSTCEPWIPWFCWTNEFRQPIFGATHLQILPVLRTSRLFFNGCILIPVLRTSIYKYSRCYAPCKGFDQMGRLRSGNLFSVLRTYSYYWPQASGYWHLAAGGFSSRGGIWFKIQEFKIGKAPNG